MRHHKLIKSAVTVGLLVSLLGCNWFSSNPQDVSNSSESSSSSDDSSSESSISSETSGQVLPDPEDSPVSGDYSTAQQQVGSSEHTDIVLNEVETYGYATFLRVVFEIEGKQTPLVTTDYSVGSNQITVNLHNIAEDNSQIPIENSKGVFNSVVSSVFHSAVGDSKAARYQIGVTEPTAYVLHVTGENPVRVYVDVREITTSGSDEAPGVNNEFTRSVQTLNTGLEGNEVSIGGYSYSTQGDVFRIIWSLQGETGALIPNVIVTPQLDGEDHSLKVEISNLTVDYISKNGVTTDLPDTTVSRLVGSYANNTSTYIVTLSKETDYKIYSSIAPGQLILDIKK